MKKEKLVIFEAGITVFLLVLTGLPTNSNPNMSIEQAAKIAVDTLMSPTGQGIVAVCITDENPDKITVSVESEEYTSLVPEQIEGFDTEVVVSGRIYALGYYAEQQSVELPKGGSTLTLGRTAHWPLLAGGISFGNAYHSGTLGVGYSGSYGYFVSCAHIIAMDNNANFLPTGSNTRVYQPAKCYSGWTNVGYLSQYITLRFGQESVNNPNHADAAKARCTHSSILSNCEVNANNNGYYAVSLTTTSPTVGQTVRLSGTTSGVKTNTVHATSATGTVYFTSTKWARFSDLIVVHPPFATAGDSGSFVDMNGYFVGLFFAYDANTNYAYVCKASYVKSGLGIS